MQIQKIEERKEININAAPNGKPIKYKILNEKIYQSIEEGSTRIILNNVCGQRFIGASLQGDIQLIINGLPGNDLGIFMDGPEITVNGNCEDQVGNTMNAGKIIIDGDAGDVIGLSARGGKILIQGDVGYRVGIHIKEYRHKHPSIIIGGTSKAFLGEYMAGGIILVLGLKFLKDGNVRENSHPITEGELGTGIHRGKIILRTEEDLSAKLGVGAKAYEICESELKQIDPLIQEFCDQYNVSRDLISQKPFKVIKPISKRPFGGNYCGQII
ncbi:MAG: hypothetical protein ACOC44_05230 [Promethearchaeia archaeon]